MIKSRDIIRQQFAKIIAAPESLWYETAKHAKSTPVCPHMSAEMRYPRGAGDSCYSSAATAFRLTGDDPGLSAKTPMDVPQDLITANRQTFVEGLKIAAPDDVMAQFLAAKIDEYVAAPYVYGTSERLYSRLTLEFPRISEKPARNVCPRRVSLEHDIREAFDDPRADDVFKPRHDRKNLSQADLLRTYKTFQKHPELLMGIQLWQGFVKNYFSEMEGFIAGHVMKDYDLVEGDLDYNSNKITDRFPLHHVAHFSANSVDLPQQLIFYGAAVTAQKQSQEIDAMPSDEDMAAGISKMQPAGFFRRSYESDWGERKIMCPFGATAVRWLTRDLCGNGLPQDSVIAQCVAKVSDALASPENKELQNMAAAVQKAMGVILNESDRCLKARLGGSQPS